VHHGRPTSTLPSIRGSGNSLCAAAAAAACCCLLLLLLLLLLQVIAFKHQAISEMFSTMQAAQAGLDSRLQQLEAELARARAARRSSSRPSSSQEGAAAVPLS
jgi:hypothetical protein